MYTASEPVRRSDGVVRGLALTGLSAFFIDVFCFLPGLIMTGLLAYLQQRASLNRIFLLPVVPVLAGLIAALLRLKIAPLIGIVAVASYWWFLGVLGVVSLKGFVLLVVFLVPLFVVFWVAFVSSVLVAVRAGVCWVFLAAIAGLFCGIVGTVVHLDHFEEQKRRGHPTIVLPRHHGSKNDDGSQGFRGSPGEGYVLARKVTYVIGSPASPEPIRCDSCVRRTLEFGPERRRPEVNWAIGPGS